MGPKRKKTRVEKDDDEFDAELWAKLASVGIARPTEEEVQQMLQRLQVDPDEMLIDATGTHSRCKCVRLPFLLKIGESTEHRGLWLRATVVLLLTVRGETLCIKEKKLNRS